MTKTEESIRSMFIAVRDYLNTNISVWTASAGMTAAVTNFTAMISNIETYSIAQQTDVKGVTVTKGSKRLALVGRIGKVANALFAFGNATNNTTLAGQAKVVESNLVKIADTLLLDKGQDIRALGNTNIVALAAYNVLPVDITALQTALQAFTADVQKPKNTIGLRKAKTEQLKAEFKKSQLHLDTILDPLVRTFNDVNSGFVLEYFNNRVIFNAGYQSLAARFIVDDSVDHLPIGNVQIEIAPGNIVKKTTDLGNALVKVLAAGSYSATLSKGGFVTQVVSFFVVDGETTTKIVSLVAV